MAPRHPFQRGNSLESNIPASVDEALSSVTIIQPSRLRTRRVYLVRLLYIHPCTYITPSLTYIHHVKPFPYGLHFRKTNPTLRSHLAWNFIHPLD